MNIKLNLILFIDYAILMASIDVYANPLTKADKIFSYHK